MTGFCKQCGMRIHDPDRCSTRYMYHEDKRLYALLRFERELCVSCYKNHPAMVKRDKEIAEALIKKAREDDQ